MLDLFEIYPAFLFVTAAFLGLVVGSFLNVVIHRLPRMMEHEWQGECARILELEVKTADEPIPNLLVPRSRCPHCDHAITAIENIPVLSYILLGGKCSGCGKRISLRYPLVEIVCGLASLAVVAKFGPSLASAGALLLTWSLICLAMIDFDTQLLPDSITLPMLWVGLLMNYFGVFVALEDAVLGAIAGYLILWSIYWLFKLATGKEGMGYGDFKLLAMLGAWLGWKMLPLVILLSSVVGAIIGVALMLFLSHDRSKPIPFGPYLAIAGWIALLWGSDITARYLYGPGAL